MTNIARSRKRASEQRASQLDDDLLPAYDFRGGVRGKHYRKLREGHTVTIHNSDGTTTVRHYQPIERTVVLDVDVHKYFPDSEAVNNALRGLITLVPKKVKTVKKTAKAR